MAEVFQTLKFDDRDIEKSIINMMTGMSKVQAKAKEASKDIQASFTVAQQTISKDQQKVVNQQLKALTDYQKAFDNIGEKVKLAVIEIEDPAAKIEAAKKITLDELDKLAAELKEKAAAAGEDPVEIEVKVKLIKEGALAEFEKQLEELRKKNEELNKKQEKDSKGGVSRIERAGKSALTVLASLAVVAGSLISAAAVAVFKFGSNSAAVDKQNQKLKKSWEDLKKTLSETFGPAAYALQKVFIGGFETLNTKLKDNKEGLKKFSIELAATVAAAGTTIISFFKNISVYNDRFLLRLEQGVVLMRTLATGDVLGGARDFQVLEARLGNLKMEIIDLSDTYKKTYSEAKIEIGKLVEQGVFKGTKATREQEAALKSLREEYNKLFEDFAQKADQANLDAIVNPFEKLRVIRQRSLDEIDLMRKTIIEKAKAAGEPVSKELEGFATSLIKGVETEYLKGLIELKNNLRKVETQVLASGKDHLDFDLFDGVFKVPEATASDPFLDLQLKTIRMSLLKANEEKAKANEEINRIVLETFKVPDSVLKDAASQGIDLSKILGSIFTNKEGQDKIDEGLEKTERDFKIKLTGIVKRSQENTKKIVADNAKADEEENDKGFLARLLGITDDQAGDLTRQFNKAFSEINSLIAEGIQSQIDDNYRLIDSIQTRLEAAQFALSKEEELQRQGSANNVASRKRELDAIKKEEAKAVQEGLELQRKANRQQIIQDGLTQASSLITAGANIFKHETKDKGLLGVLLAITAITAMLVFFAKLKSNARKETAIKAEHGGALKDYGFVNRSGRTDKHGGRGHRIEDSNLVVGGREFITNEVTAARHGKFLEKMNQGKYDHVNLEETIQEKIERQKRITEWVKSDTFREAQVIRIRNIETQPAGRAIPSRGAQVSLERLEGAKFSPPTFSQTHQEYISSFLKDIASRPNLAPEGRELFKAAKKEAKQKAREFVTKAELEKMFADQVKAIAASSGVIEKAIINRPIIVPTTKDTTGYIKKTPTLHERIIFD